MKMQKSDLKSHTKLAMSNECGSEQDLLHNLPNIKTKKKIFKMNWIFKNKTHSKSVKTSANHNLPFMNRKKVKMGMKSFLHGRKIKRFCKIRQSFFESIFCLFVFLSVCLSVCVSHVWRA
jgi:hypothetical protein